MARNWKITFIFAAEYKTNTTEGILYILDSKKVVMKN